MRPAIFRCQMLTANEFCHKLVRGQWHRAAIAPGGRWRTREIEVEVNLAESKSEPDRWHTMKLLYVRGVNPDRDTPSSKRDWALFLSTDAQLGAARMLEVYAMRWAIEVFFRESKQNLKWLGEQSRSYASHVASLHFSSDCYLMLVHARLHRELDSLARAREHLRETIQPCNCARRLWQAFRVIVHQAVDSLQTVSGTQATVVMQAIDRKMEDFLTRILQLDPLSISRDHDMIGISAS